MIGYVTLGTNDLPRAKAFYDTLLAEIGVKRLMEFDGRGYAWAASMDKPMLCIMKPYDGRPATVGNGVMAGITVDSRTKVDSVYKKALELGIDARGSTPQEIQDRLKADIVKWGQVIDKAKIEKR